MTVICWKFHTPSLSRLMKIQSSISLQLLPVLFPTPNLLKVSPVLIWPIGSANRLSRSDILEVLSSLFQFSFQIMDVLKLLKMQSNSQLKVHLHPGTWLGLRGDPDATSDPHEAACSGPFTLETCSDPARQVNNELAFRDFLTIPLKLIQVIHTNITNVYCTLSS